MPTLLLPYPQIDPILFHWGFIVIRWYALAYLAGLVAGCWLIRRYVGDRSLWGGQEMPSPQSVDDLLFYVAVGVIVGGRLGHVLFYDPATYLANPVEVFKVWEGGMAFHGGLLGAVVGILWFCRITGAPWLSMLDLAALVAPIGLFFGRMANFIKPELWGRPTDLPWAMVFPGSDGQPRHPSQLYEAALEGLVTFVILQVFKRAGWLRSPGRVAGAFGVLYALARTFSEFFRDPDPRLEDLGHGLTMGMVLSLPMAAVGVALLVYSFRRKGASA